MYLVELAAPKEKTSGYPEIKGKPEVLTVLPRLYKAKREILSNLSFGARGGSRTRTSLRTPAPEAGESTNSTTRASYSLGAVAQRRTYISTESSECQQLFLEIFVFLSEGIFVDREGWKWYSLT